MPYGKKGSYGKGAGKQPMATPKTPTGSQNSTTSKSKSTGMTYKSKGKMKYKSKGKMKY